MSGYNELAQEAIHDGFHSLFKFKEHRLQIRGFGLVEVSDDGSKQSDYNMRHNFISWDAKQLLLWENNITINKPRVLHQVKFNGNKGYISTLVLVTKMKVFLAAALDMTFKIFDRKLNLLESIRHEERAILQMEYDSVKDIIITAGASSVSAWRLYRNTTLDAAHIMEKLFTFDGAHQWITKLLYEPQYDRVYGIKDRSVQVMTFAKQGVEVELFDVHDAPVNVVCWYNRNQFYLTGCTQGEIKCWTTHYTANRKSSGGSTAVSSTAMKISTEHKHQHGGSSQGRTFALLHVFKGHHRAVTAIKMHSISGLAITTSLDGYIKVLNLEALTELFCFCAGDGVLDMRMISIGPMQHGILFSQTTPAITLWKITNLASYFGVSTSRIERLLVFENLEYENILHRRQQLRAQLEERHAQQAKNEKINSVASATFAYIDAHKRMQEQWQEEVSKSQQFASEAFVGGSTGTAQQGGKVQLRLEDRRKNIETDQKSSFVMNKALPSNFFQHVNDQRYSTIEELHGAHAMISQNIMINERDEDDEDEDDELAGDYSLLKSDDEDENDFGAGDRKEAVGGNQSAAGTAAASAIGGGTSTVIDDDRTIAEKSHASTMGRGDEDGNGEADEDDNQSKSVSTRHTASAMAQQIKDEKQTKTKFIPALSRKLERVLISTSRQDVRMYSSAGKVIGRLEPEFVVDGIKALSVSIFQGLLFCLCDQDLLRIHDLRSFTMPLLKQLYIAGNRTDKDGDLATCCTMIDILPSSINRTVSNSKLKQKLDLRGNSVPKFLEMFLVVGMKNGSILFLDTLQNMETQLSMQANHGMIVTMEFRKRQKQLFVLGKDVTDNTYSVKVWRFPAVEVAYHVYDLHKVTAFAAALTISAFAIGTSTGNIRFFHSTEESSGGNDCEEVMRPGHQHAGSINTICFCDELRVFMSCDITGLILVWDFEKRLVRTIQLNLQVVSMAVNGRPGDVLVVQGDYLLTVERVIWDEGNAIATAKNMVDPFQDSDFIGKESVVERQQTSIADASDEFPASVERDNSVVSSVISKQHGELGDDSLSREPDNEERNQSIGNKETHWEHHKAVQSHELKSFIVNNKKTSHFRSMISTELQELHRNAAHVGGEERGTTRLRNSLKLVRHSAAQSPPPTNHLDCISEVSGGDISSVRHRGDRLNSVVSRKESFITQKKTEDPFLPHLDLDEFVVVRNGCAVDDNHGNNMRDRKILIDDHHPNSLDVHHPRFLLHRKPPARDDNFFALEQHLLDAQMRATAEVSHTAVVSSHQVLSTQVGKGPEVRFANEADEDAPSQTHENAAPPIAKRMGQLGLSPRARMTLLNSTIVDPKLRKLQENVIVSSTGMKVSSSYKEKMAGAKREIDDEFSKVLREPKSGHNSAQERSTTIRMLPSESVIRAARSKTLAAAAAVSTKKSGGHKAIGLVGQCDDIDGSSSTSELSQLSTSFIKPYPANASHVHGEPSLASVAEDSVQ